MSTCNTESCVIHTESKAADECSTEQKCPSEQFINESCCPSEKAIQMWGAAFPAAIKEVQVELLKERIKKSWGSHMAKEADAIIEAMGSFWYSMMARAKARKDLSEKFKEIFESAAK